MKKTMKKASRGMEKKKRGGDYMEPNKELQFGGLKRDPDKETYYGGPNTRAGRIKKRADNKAGRITARGAGKSAKQSAKNDGMSNKAARLAGRGIRKAVKAESTHSRRNSTIGEKINKSNKIRDKYAEKSEKAQNNADAKKQGKRKIEAARNRYEKGGLKGRKKAQMGAMGVASMLGGMAGNAMQNSKNPTMQKVGKGLGMASQVAGMAGGMGGGGAAASADGQQKTMQKGGKKRKMMGGKKMKYKTGGAKPDYLDMDKDGNKTESMKSALKDRRSRAQKGKVKPMKKRDFPSNAERAAMTQHAKDRNMSQRLQAYGMRKSNEQIGREAADIGTAGLVPNKAGKKMQANKKLKTKKK